MHSEDGACPSLLVFGDSLAFHGPTEGLPATDPRIWPQRAAAAVGWEAELVARIGWTARDAWWAAIHDPRVWGEVSRAGAVILAVGGMDSLPSPLPTAVREQIRYVRPARLRALVRRCYQAVQPRLAPWGWPMALPPRVTVDYLERLRNALRQLRPDLPIIATLPSTHCSAAYGEAHPGRIATTAAIRRWATAHDVPLVDFYALTVDHVRGHQGNPDGLHWGFEAHRVVGNAMAEAVRAAAGLEAMPAEDDPAAVPAARGPEEVTP